MCVCVCGWVCIWMVKIRRGCPFRSNPQDKWVIPLCPTVLQYAKIASIWHGHVASGLFLIRGQLDIDVLVGWFPRTPFAPCGFPRTGCNAPGRVLFGCFVRLPQRINLQLYGINKCRGEVMISSSSLPLCSRPSREILPSSFAALNGGWSCWC